MSLLYESDLARDLAYSVKTSEAFARQMLYALKLNLTARMLAGDVVALTGFGRFHCKKVAAKRLYCPRTGKTGRVEAHLCPAWQPSPALKQKIRRIGPTRRGAPGAPGIGRGGAPRAPGKK